LWVAGDPRGDDYEKYDLPVLATALSHNWEEFVEPNGSNLTPTVLAMVKKEIVDLLVSSFAVSPPDGFGTVVVRRSNRVAGGSAESHAIVPASSNKRRITMPPPSDSSDSDDDDDDSKVSMELESDSEPESEDAKKKRLIKFFQHQFRRPDLRALWEEHEYVEVGTLEIACINAHLGKSRQYTNAIINSYGGRPFSVDHYEAIVGIGKSRLGELRKNFTLLRKWINDRATTKLYETYDEQLLLEYVTGGERETWTKGLGLTRGLFYPTGPKELRPEVAFIIMHILFTNPNIGISKFPELFTEMHVLMTGKAPSEDQIPSPSTIRSYIKQITNLDEYDIQQQYIALSKDKSPAGEKRYFGLLSDDTKHGRSKHHVAILTIDNLSKTGDRQSSDLKERWRVSPQYILATTGQAIKADCESNSDLNIECMMRLVPDEAFPHFNIFASDNANDASKEGRLTWEKYIAKLRELGLDVEILSGGVDRELTQLGNFFHIQQLVINYMSEFSCGKTEKGNHDKVHHRQLIQTLWDIFIRDVVVFMRTANEILDTIEDSSCKWVPKPMRERDTRWLTNGRAAENILVGYYIQDENGTPFWVLLCHRLMHIYTKSDFRYNRLKALAEQFLMPEMIFGLWVEAEVVKYFEESFGFHAGCGQIADSPGFRGLELFYEIFDHSFPWWQATLENPEARFPNTYKHIQETTTDKGLIEMAEMKLAQLKEGIVAAHTELAKMYEKFFDGSPWVFTGFTCPKRGHTILRVVLRLVHEAGVDLDGVYDDEEHLIDESLDWEYEINAPELPSDTYKAFYNKLEPNKHRLAHFFQQHNYLKSNCRNELKRLSALRSVTTRDPNSETRLLDFAAEYPIVFDRLWCQFALSPSATRICEQFHSIERHAYNNQVSADLRDARARYLVVKEYAKRKERRAALIRRMKESGIDAEKILKCSPYDGGDGWSTTSRVGS